jgi:hypothetical protein
LTLLDVVLRRQRQLEQMAHRRGQHVLVALEVVALAREAAERARNVAGDRGLLRDNQLLRHEGREGYPQKVRRINCV